MENTQKNSQSFRMDSLLSEMRELEVAALTKSTSSSEVYTSHNSLPRNENTSDWANQYLESGSTFAVNISHVHVCLGSIICSFHFTN